MFCIFLCVAPVLHQKQKKDLANAEKSRLLEKYGF